MKQKKFKYDVALSFAGEDRTYVKQVANYLAESGIRVFYDDFEKPSLWGKNLHDHLSQLYRNEAKYVVIFASKRYKEKNWTTLERQSAQARASTQKAEYILPARFDDTEIPGILNTVGYIDLNGLSPIQFGELIEEKLGRSAFWRQQAVAAANYFHRHRFSVHRGAALWSPNVVAVFANDGRTKDLSYFQDFLDSLQPNTILAKAYDEEEYSLAVLIRSKDAERAFTNIWASFANEQRRIGSKTWEYYVKHEMSGAHWDMHSYFENPLHPTLAQNQ